MGDSLWRGGNLVVKKAVLVTIAAVVVLALLLSFYADWLWFKSLGYQAVFLTIAFTKLGLGFVLGVLFLGIVGGNLYLAWRLDTDKGLPARSPFGQLSTVGLPEDVTRESVGVLVGVAALGIAVITGIGAAAHWELFLKYLNAQSFGLADPIFDRDVGFYVFSLPLFDYLQNWLLVSVSLAAIGVIGVYYVIDKAVVFAGRLFIMPHAQRHLSGLIGSLLLVMGWGYWLRLFKLMYSTRGVAYGANFTDVNVQLPITWIFLVLAVVLGLVFLANIYLQRQRILLWGSLGFVAALLILGLVPSALVQKLIVEPNELAKDEEYIRYNIEFTRRAYGLDRVREEDFPAAEDLGLSDLERNQLTIQNIRIWDERPLLRTYSQIQEIRLYYDFSAVDVDRYWLDGEYRQVMLSPRELVTEQIPSQVNTWLNQKLQYTHGYGLALSPVNQVTLEGLPELLIKDVPPVSSTSLRVTRPELYFGERTSSYVVVKTGTLEFDYPKGDENAYTTYAGTGGVPVGSLINRVAFTVKFLDINLLLSRYIKAESRIMLNRTVSRRVKTLAPFLSYDSDPYLFISDEGRLLWIQDAYTTTSRYPYSEPVSGRRLNYIRNSVKVVIDAYNGSVDFYVVDPEDPVVRSYIAIFPGLFKPWDETPDDVRAHVRYPKDLFQIQVVMYRSYHMTDARVFYNQEDLWAVANEVYSDNRQAMEPYYIVIRLPSEVREEFLLMLPLTPSKKDNMIAWMAARSDPGVYGELLVYKLPKDKLVFGPMQIEARVDQQTEISRELTLWGQRGSRVIRGNLLVIPIGQSFIYVEPVYLEARQGEGAIVPAAGEARGADRRQPTRPSPAASMDIGSASLPELKMVIVAHGNRLAMRENLGLALQAVFGGGPQVTSLAAPEAPSPAGATDATVQELAAAARSHYEKARQYLKEENWSGFGQEWQALQEVLRQLDSRLGAAERRQP